MFESIRNFQGLYRVKADKPIKNNNLANLKIVFRFINYIQILPIPSKES